MAMTDRVKGKKCLVYGGGSGIGLACSEALLREGAHVFISGRRANVLSEAHNQLSSLGPCAFLAGDATQVSAVQHVTQQAANFLGGIDTIVISAGAGGRTSIFDCTSEEFQRIIDNTLRPVFLAVQHALACLQTAGPSSIIVISSMYGLVGQKERVAYCAAKAGVNGMVKALALDLAELSIRVNAICPGFVETPLSIEVAKLEQDPVASINSKRLMHPIPRAGRLEEIAELAVYLASDLSSFTTGQAIAVDGGYTAR